MAIHRIETGTIVDHAWVKYEKPLTVTTHVGRVLRVFNEDYRAMSDVYTLATFAEVLTDDLKIQRVLVNANFECDTSGGRAEVDATPGVLAIKKSLDLIAEGQKREWKKKRDEELAEAEKNRPVKGKKMVVTRGRKVPVGTVGVVAYVHENGNVLLKDPEIWQDRKASGQWVNASYLKAV